MKDSVQQCYCAQQNHQISVMATNSAPSKTLKRILISEKKDKHGQEGTKAIPKHQIKREHRKISKMTN